MKMDPENKIKGVDIHLKGFTMEELKDIIGYIRSVEAHRESRVVLVNIVAPEDNTEESLSRILEMWPDEERPPFMATLKKKKTHTS